MEHPNPTPIRTGMTATLFAKRYRIAGRIVMAAEDAGQTWHWNEFHLVATSGESATLVHEDYGDGPQWKLFTDLHPGSPISATEAARLQAGDVVHLTGVPVPVTLTGESRVVEIEGTAPEGVEVGDIARYFNAEAPGQFLVGSWTGDEIEFYRGRTLGAAAIAAAFQLPASQMKASGTGPGSHSAGVAWGIGAVLVVVLVSIIGGQSCRRMNRTSGPARIAAPAALAKPGDIARLAGQPMRVLHRATVEIAEVDRFHRRHEYLLESADGTRWLLATGWAATGGDWQLLRPIDGPPGIGPVEAAAWRRGATVEAGGLTATITALYRCTGLEADAEASAPGTLPAPGSVTYGLLARSTTNILIARWDAQGIRWHRGYPIPAQDAAAAFPAASGAQ